MWCGLYWSTWWARDSLRILIHGNAQETCPPCHARCASKNHGTIGWLPAPHASSGIDEWSALEIGQSPQNANSSRLKTFSPLVWSFQVPCYKRALCRMYHGLHVSIWADPLWQVVFFSNKILLASQNFIPSRPSLQMPEMPAGLGLFLSKSLPNPGLPAKCMEAFRNHQLKPPKFSLNWSELKTSMQHPQTSPTHPNSLCHEIGWDTSVRLCGRWECRPQQSNCNAYIWHKSIPIKLAEKRQGRHQGPGWSQLLAWAANGIKPNHETTSSDMTRHTKS